MASPTACKAKQRRSPGDGLVRSARKETPRVGCWSVSATARQEKWSPPANAGTKFGLPATHHNPLPPSGLLLFGALPLSKPTHVAGAGKSLDPLATPPPLRAQ